MGKKNWIIIFLFSLLQIDEVMAKDVYVEVVEVLEEQLMEETILLESQTEEAPADFIIQEENNFKSDINSLVQYCKNHPYDYVQGLKTNYDLGLLSLRDLKKLVLIKNDPEIIYLIQLIDSQK
jgi:hypothetical protein